MGAEYAQKYQQEQTNRVYQAGETIKFNTEVTSGFPYIRYNPASGVFTIERPGKYVVNFLMYAACIAYENHTRICIRLNGRTVSAHDVILPPYGPVPFTFTDVINTESRNAELCFINVGRDIILSESVEVVSNMTIWGLV